MPAPRLSRLCFSLKSLLLFNVVVAVLLVVAYPAWKEQAIRSVFIQGRPKPLWWPQSWRDYHDLLAHKRFEVVYTIDESLTERRLIEGLKFALESFVEGRTPLSDLVYSELAKAFHRETGIRPTVPPKVRWSADGNKCTVEATGDDHKHIHALVARWRARPFYSPREFEIRCSIHQQNGLVASRRQSRRRSAVAPTTQFLQRSLSQFKRRFADSATLRRRRQFQAASW